MPLEPFQPRRRRDPVRILFWIFVPPVATLALAVIAGLVWYLGFEHY